MATTRKAFGSDAQVIEVQEQHDKAELIGVPFIIREAWLEITGQGVEYLFMKVETENDGTKVVKDSSTTGVKVQVMEELSKVLNLTEPFTVETGKLTSALFAPRGLRVSEYDVVDRRGKTKKAKTYYIG